MKNYRVITGTIELLTALHIGTGKGSAATDALCRKNSAGQWTIPGTALGGALRSLATRLAPRFSPVGTCLALQEDSKQLASCKCIVCELFGFRFLDASDKDSHPSAARLSVADAVAKDQTHTRIRDGVGINRTYQSAEREGASKFDVEVVPAGTKFDLRIELEDEDDASDHEVLLAAILSEWQSGRATLGGRAARGLGSFVLRDTKLIKRPLTSTAGLIGFLASDTPWQYGSANADCASIDETWICNQSSEFRARVKPNDGLLEAVAGSFWTVELELKCDGPLVVNDPAAAAMAGYDFVPYVEQFQQGSRIVLPGSSVRGVFRSQAERIARTIASQTASASNDSLAAFLHQCPACDPLQNNQLQGHLASCQSLVKGYGKVSSTTDAQKTNQTVGYNPEQVPIDKFCPACQLFGSTYFGSRLRIEDAYSTCTTFHAQDFLKIDRFTGGGVDGAKFDAIAAWQPEFTVRMVLENPRATELAWLSFVLLDLKEGLLRFGFGGSKGYGRVTFDNARLRLGYLDQSDLTLMKTDRPVETSTKTTPDGIYHAISFQWDDWLKLMNDQGLVAEFHDQLTSFSRGAFSLDGKQWQPMSLKKDSYFNVPAANESQVLLSNIYPIQRVTEPKSQGEA